jgi:hypothetical protein
MSPHIQIDADKSTGIQFIPSFAGTQFIIKTMANFFVAEAQKGRSASSVTTSPPLRSVITQRAPSDLRTQASTQWVEEKSMLTFMVISPSGFISSKVLRPKGIDEVS